MRVIWNEKKRAIYMGISPFTATSIILIPLLLGFVVGFLRGANYSRPKERIHFISPVPIATPSAEPKPLNNAKPKKTSYRGIASYYSRQGCLGCSSTLTMANGEPLDDSKLTIAFNKAKLNNHVLIVNIKNGLSVEAKVADTGGFERLGRIADLTPATKEAIGCNDLCEVEIREL